MFLFSPCNNRQQTILKNCIIQQQTKKFIPRAQNAYILDILSNGNWKIFQFFEYLYCLPQRLIEITQL